MSLSDEYYYNEHDENQVRKIYKKNKKKKLKRRFKIFIILSILILVGWYFVSDYSKVQSIRIVGNEDITSEDILKNISVNQSSIHLLVRPSTLEKEVKSLGMVKKVNVTKDFMGYIKIEVEEAEKVAYCVIAGKTYVIDELGNVTFTNDQDLIHSLQSCPKISEFKDLEFLKTFAKEYVKISELIKNQTSDIVYVPEKSDDTRLKFIMNNGKIMYLRVGDMADQLSRIDYEAFMTGYEDRCEFSFEGDYVYMKKCK